MSVFLLPRVGLLDEVEGDSPFDAGNEIVASAYRVDSGLERLARESVGGGRALVEFYLAVFDGKPFKVGNKRVYPTLDQRLEAAARLEVRGWGRPKQEVVVDEGQTQGFTFIFRRWGYGEPQGGLLDAHSRPVL